jgi:hypothetical protein
VDLKAQLNQLAVCELLPVHFGLILFGQIVSHETIRHSFFVIRAGF